MIGGFVGIIFFAAVALAGVIWQQSGLFKTSGAREQKSEFVWMMPKIAAERFVPPDVSAVTRLRDLLLAGDLIARGVPHYGSAGDPSVMIAAAEWQTLKIAGQDFSAAASSQGPAKSYDNIEIASVKAAPLPKTPAVDLPQAMAAQPQPAITYSQQEVARLVEVLFDARKFMDDQPVAIEQEFLPLRNDWGSQILKEGSADYVAKLNKLIRDLNAFYGVLNDFIYRKYPLYKIEVRTALNVDAIANGIVEPINSFAEYVDALPEQPQQKNLKMLTDRHKAFDEAYLKWRNWIGSANERIETTTSNLRQKIEYGGGIFRRGEWTTDEKGVAHYMFEQCETPTTFATRTLDP